MRYRKIETRLWGDAGFRALSGLQPSAKALWLYLLTNPHASNFAAALPVGCATIADDLGWSAKEVDRCMSELEKAGMVSRDDSARLVYLRKWAAHNPPDNPNVAAGWASSIAALPECALRGTLLRDARQICGGEGELFLAAFDRSAEREMPGAVAAAETEPDSATPEQVGELVENLAQALTGGEARQTAKRNGESIAAVYDHYRRYHKRSTPTLSKLSREYKLIKSRLDEGYSVEDLQLAIDGNHLDPWHCGENDRKKEYHDLTLIMRDSTHVRKFVEVMEPATTGAKHGNV